MLLPMKMMMKLDHRARNQRLMYSVLLLMIDDADENITLYERWKK
jgi:hypothetical protein